MNKYLIVGYIDENRSKNDERFTKIVEGYNKLDAVKKYMLDNWKSGGFFWERYSERVYSPWSRWSNWDAANDEEFFKLMLGSLINDFGEEIGQEIFNYYMFLEEFNDDKEEDHTVYPTYEQDYKLSDSAILSLTKSDAEEILSDEKYYSDFEILSFDEIDLIK